MCGVALRNLIVACIGMTTFVAVAETPYFGNILNGNGAIHSYIRSDTNLEGVITKFKIKGVPTELDMEVELTETLPNAAKLIQIGEHEIEGKKRQCYQAEFVGVLVRDCADIFRSTSSRHHKRYITEVGGNVIDLLFDLHTTHQRWHGYITKSAECFTMNSGREVKFINLHHSELLTHENHDVNAKIDLKGVGAMLEALGKKLGIEYDSTDFKKEVGKLKLTAESPKSDYDNLKTLLPSRSSK